MVRISRRYLAWASAALLVLVFGSIAWQSHAAIGAREFCTYLLWATFPIYIAGAWLQWRHKRSFGLPFIFAIALAVRVVMAFSFPIFSDDIWRYLWDGHVQMQGINPFLHAPDSDVLAAYKASYHSLINYPEISTIYPGVSQLTFASIVGVGGGESLMRLVFAAVEMAAVPAVWRLAGATSEQPKLRALLALLCWWNPLMVVEFAGSGHLDPLAFTPLVWALALIQGRGKVDSSTWRGWAVAGGLIGISIGAKLVGGIGLVAIAAWAFHTSRSWKERLKVALPRVFVSAAAATLVVIATSLPYQTPLVFGESASFTGSLSNYARKWRWNDGPYRVIYAAQESALYSVAGASPEHPPMWRFDSLADTFRAAKITHQHEGKTVASTTMPVWDLAAMLVKLFTLALLGFFTLFAFNQGVRPAPMTMLLFGTALLMSAVVHPWYVAWLLPLALAHKTRGFILWSGLATLSYIPHFDQMPWLLGLEYIPVVGLVCWDGWRGLVGSSKGGKSVWGEV